MRADRKMLIGWSLLLFLGLIWGSSYILIKKGLEAFDPVELAALRISISALAFMPLFFGRWSTINWKKWPYLLVVGFAGSFIPAFLFAFAQTELNSSTTGVLSSLTPLFTLVLGVLFFKVPLQWIKLFGVLIGLGGAIFLIGYTRQEGLGGDWRYGFLAVAACAFYATSVNTVKTYLWDMSAPSISAAAFFLVGLPAIGYLAMTDIGWRIAGEAEAVFDRVKRFQ